MNAHTPGPWEVVCNAGGYPSKIHAPNGYTGPGGLRDVTRGAAICFPSSNEGRANARLMAAAPELLAALRGLLRVCPRVRAGATLAEYDAARAAIAHATGGEA
jgi:hypothetical protein